MNKIIKTIKERRSIRSYQKKQITEKELNTIIDAANWAPSAHNQQPWHFLIIQKKELINHISNIAKENMAKSDSQWAQIKAKDNAFHLFYNAPTIILVSGKKDAVSPLVDSSAAIQNMLLAAKSLGIGSCWIGLIRYFLKDKKETEKLNIPNDYSPYYAVTLGYPKDNKQMPPERKNTNFKIVK